MTPAAKAPAPLAKSAVRPAVKNGKKPPLAPKARQSLKSLFGFFALEAVTADVLADEQAANAARARLLTIVTAQAVAIAVLGGILIFGAPFFEPVYKYYALNGKQQAMPLVSLTMPNMTNRAVLSWVTSSITEIMTFGFGDYETKLAAQKNRFTPNGWDAFVHAFINEKIGETFKKNQLVLTTVPSNTPVILGQGVNEKNVYEWQVQMPVVMTYATNNNVTRRETAIIDLTIVRVPLEQNPFGIGIETWSFEK